MIAGHTHRPVYPNVGENLYFNDGTCIHPDGITCIEIENGKITLVKWALELKLVPTTKGFLYFKANCKSLSKCSGCEKSTNTSKIGLISFWL